MYFSREENGNVLKCKNSNIDIKNKWPSDVRPFVLNAIYRLLLLKSFSQYLLNSFNMAGKLHHLL